MRVRPSPPSREGSPNASRLSHARSSPPSERGQPKSGRHHGTPDDKRRETSDFGLAIRPAIRQNVAVQYVAARLAAGARSPSHPAFQAGRGHSELIPKRDVRNSEHKSPQDFGREGDGVRFFGAEFDSPHGTERGSEGGNLVPWNALLKCIVAGLVWSFVIAWIATLASPRSFGVPSDLAWAGAPPLGWPRESESFLDSRPRINLRGLGVYEIAPRAKGITSPPGPGLIAAGFPFLVVHARTGTRRVWDGSPVDDLPVALGALPLPDALPSAQRLTRGLPYAPLWRGLVANTVFWASALFAFRSGVSRVRRLRNNGRCPQCRHTVLPSQRVCPECGGGL